MYAQVEKLKESKSRSVANSTAQKKGNVKQYFEFVDNRPVAKQIAQFQLKADKFTGSHREKNNTGLQVNLKNKNENTVLKSDVKVNSETIQKRDRNAVVVWNVTHEVFPDKESSLFGEDSDPLKNEGIELHQGNNVVVDDEDIFQSRRGANQELSERRKEDKEGHLTNKWIKLKELNGVKVSGHGYVRDETIRMVKDVQEQREIVGEQVDKETAKKAGDEIYNAWVDLRKKRRMSVGAWERWEKTRKEKEKDTSPSWDQIEEGHDVSNQLSHSAPEEYDNYSVEEDFSQGIFTVRDITSNAAIGIIVIEKRTTTSFPLHNDDNNKKWYLRWLIGHPTLKGAGVMLLKLAMEHVKKNGGTGVWVESAPSAMEWYKNKGFKPLTKEKQKEYNSEFEKGWDSPLMILNLE